MRKANPARPRAEEMPTPSASEPLRVFWQPGCSSCVRVKEFLNKLGVDYQSINILENADGRKELERLGARSVPIVSQGSRYTFAQSLTDVATFVGKPVQTSVRLPPADLVARWLHILTAAQRYVAQIPDAHFRDQAVPGRNRSVCDLAHHIFEIPEAFLATAKDGREDWKIHIRDHAPAGVQNIHDILVYARMQTSALVRWWHAQAFFPTEAFTQSTQRVSNFGGRHVMHEFLERCTWHSAQHTRQLIAVLESFGVSVNTPLSKQDYEGLPLPEGLWA